MQKFEICGSDKLACKWFKSVLKGRKQKVIIGNKVSRSVELMFGITQGGLLSPIIFVIFGAVMEQWVRHSMAFTYAHDTSTSVQDKDIKFIIGCKEGIEFHGIKWPGIQTNQDSL
jgi:retron-type reverse transcriptase